MDEALKNADSKNNLRLKITLDNPSAEETPAPKEEPKAAAAPATPAAEKPATPQAQAQAAPPKPDKPAGLSLSLEPINEDDDEPH